MLNIKWPRSGHKLMASLRLELEDHRSAKRRERTDARPERPVEETYSFWKKKYIAVKGGNKDVAALPIERRACPCAIEANLTYKDSSRKSRHCRTN